MEAIEVRGQIGGTRNPTGAYPAALSEIGCDAKPENDRFSCLAKAVPRLAYPACAGGAPLQRADAGLKVFSLMTSFTDCYHDTYRPALPKVQLAGDATEAGPVLPAGPVSPAHSRAHLAGNRVAADRKSTRLN